MGILAVISPDLEVDGEEGRAVLARLLPEAAMVALPDLSDAVADLHRDEVVVAAGGDGTVGAVARAVVGTSHPMGIVPMGTFNNFSRAVGVPLDLEEAAGVVRAGAVHPVSVGRANGHVFLEAAAVGLFGDVIALGEAAKEREYGELLDRIGRVVAAEPFAYRVDGDLRLAGHSRSLVAANTRSTGALVPIGDASPRRNHLVLSAPAEAPPTLAVLRLALAALLHRRRPIDRGRRFRRIRITTEPAVPVVVIADTEEVGTTPVEIAVDRGALRLLLPA